MTKGKISFIMQEKQKRQFDGVNDMVHMRRMEMNLLSEQMLEKMCGTRERYEKAEKYFQEDRFLSMNMIKASEHSIKFQFEIEMQDAAVYEPEIEVEHKEGEYVIKDYHCNCFRRTEEGKICPHAAAAVMKIEFQMDDFELDEFMEKPIGAEENIYIDEESEWEEEEFGHPFPDLPFSVRQDLIHDIIQNTAGVKTSSGRTFGMADQRPVPQTSQSLLNAMSEIVLEDRNKFCLEIADGDVRLETTLHLEKDKEYIDLRIGKRQFYVVKSIPELVKNIRSQKFVKYGKNLEFVHTQTAFCKQNQPLVSFLMGISFPAEPYGYYYQPAYGKRNLELDSEQLDELIQILSENPQDVYVEGLHMYEKVPAVFKWENPYLPVRINSEKTGKNVIITMPGIILLEGVRQYYVYWENCMYICSEEFCREMKNILPLMSSNVLRKDRGERYFFSSKRNSELVLQKKDYTSFCTTLLPIMQKYMDVEINGIDFSEYQIEEGIYNLYLELDEKDSVICRAEAIYGEKKHNLRQLPTVSETYRDVRTEYELRTLLRQYFPFRTDDGKAWLLANDDDRLAALVEDGVGQLQNLAEVYASDEFKKIRMANQVKVTTGLSVKGNLLNVSWDVQAMPASELLEILQLYKQKKKYHKLKNGELLNLQNSGIEALAQLQEDLHISKAQLKAGMAGVPLYRALYLDTLSRENAEKIMFDKDKSFQLLIDRFDSIKAQSVEVPEEIKAELRPYQKDGYRWACALSQLGFGGILADDMGLGKTLQMITYLCQEKEGTHLVVCPASLVYNWQAEFEKFAPGVKVGIVAGTVPEREKVIEEYQSFDVLITSYDLLKRDIELYQNKCFDCEIIDEAQYIKNPSTQAAKAVKSIESRNRFALTGTPVENRLSELWSIFEYLMPGYLYKYKTFKEQFEEQIVRGSEKEEKNALERLHKMIAPFLMRRLKRDVLTELPNKVEEVVYAKFEPKQERIYKAMEAQIVGSLKKSSKKQFQDNKLQILAQLTRLRQICCDPSLLYEDYKDGSAKLDVCMEYVQNAMEGGHRILLFSQFTTMLDVIEDKLKKQGIRTLKLTGSTSKAKRRELVERFQDNRADVFLISLKAGGTGLNLTAADIVIHYDPWWNVAAQNQATDRTHRIGQEHKVTVIKLIAKHTIEERILKLQEKKKDLADKIISGEDMSLSAFTKEALLELFQTKEGTL